MNNIKAIAAILMAATLVVGATFVVTPTAFAYQKKGVQDNGNSKNANTVTIEKCKQRGSVSGFDNTAEQECQNVICTHPGNNASCTKEGAVQTPTPPANDPCVECFTSLVSQGLLSQEQVDSILAFLHVTSLADLCTALESGAISGHQLGEALGHAGVGEGGGIPLEKCLQGLGIVVGG